MSPQFRALQLRFGLLQPLSAPFLLPVQDVGANRQDLALANVHYQRRLDECLRSFAPLIAISVPHCGMPVLLATLYAPNAQDEKDGGTASDAVHFLDKLV